MILPDSGYATLRTVRLDSDAGGFAAFAESNGTLGAVSHFTPGLGGAFGAIANVAQRRSGGVGEFLLGASAEDGGFGQGQLL